MLSLLIIMGLFVITINAINIYQMEKRIDRTLELLTDNRGKFPKPIKDKGPEFNFGLMIPFGLEITEETQFMTRYFLIEYDKDFDVRKIDTSHISAISSESAYEYGEKVLELDKNKGYEDIYRYALVPSFDGYTIIFMDSRAQIQTTMIFLVITVGVALVTMLLLLIPVSLFSKKAVTPIIHSMEKQKTFITDAGHEIKTPLAIISANADVLELTTGESEWITSIRNQTVRLDKLVKNLLMLTKVEQGMKESDFKLFDISLAVKETAESFLPIAEARKKDYQIEIEEGLNYYGDEDGIIQLTSTLIDNAMKYSNENGTIRIQLLNQKKGIKLQVYNTTEQMKSYKKEDLDKLFERFYRSDDSRSRDTGGYGIGLSITKSIVEAHKGKICIKSGDGKQISFIVSL